MASKWQRFGVNAALTFDRLAKQWVTAVDRVTVGPKVGPALDRLEQIMNSTHPAGVEWVHAEIGYEQLNTSLEVFLDRASVHGWALAAMGPRSIVLRNRLGGRW